MRCFFISPSLERFSSDWQRQRGEQEMWRRKTRVWASRTRRPDFFFSYFNGNWFKLLPSRTCIPLRSLQQWPQNNTRSGSRGEKTKKTKKRKSPHINPLFSPFLRRKPQRKTDPSLSVSFLNQRPFCTPPLLFFFFLHPACKKKHGTITHACGCLKAVAEI